MKFEKFVITPCDINSKMGRPRKVSNTDILQVLRPTVDPTNLRAMTTSAVSEQVDLGRDQTRNRLNDLAVEGWVGRERFSDTMIWWLTEEGRDYLDELED